MARAEALMPPGARHLRLVPPPGRVESRAHAEAASRRTVALLALVLHPSSRIEAYGASRLIALGPSTIQPSEMAKLALIVFAATVLARKWNRLDDVVHIALPLVPVTALVACMVMIQPDLGTTLILTGCVFLLLFVAGV